MESSSQTERTIIESALRESEQRHELLFRSAPGPMWVFDVETLRILAANDAATVEYGYTREEFLELTLRDIRARDSRGAYWRSHAAMRAGHDMHGIYKHRRRDGSLIDVEVRTSTLPAGYPRLRLLLATDITVQKRGADAALFLDRASSVLMASLELEFLCRNLSVLAVPALGDWCVVHRITNGTAIEPCGYAHANPLQQGLLGELVGERGATRASDPVACAWRDAAVIEVAGAAAIAAGGGLPCMRADELARLLDISTVLYVPIIGNGRTLAVLECGAGAGRTSYDTSARALAMALAERAALALANAMRFDEVRTAALGRTPTARPHDVAGSAEWLVESIPDCYFAVNGEWIITYANREAEKLMGRSREEMVGQFLWALFPDAVGGVFDTAYRKVVAEQQPVVLNEYYPGLDAWFEVHARPARDGLALFFRDVTRHRRAAERLEESELQFRDFTEQATDLIHMLGADGRILYGNRAWCETLGYTEEEVRQMHFSQVVAPESLELALSMHRRSKETSSPEDTELVVLRKDGTRLVVRGRSNWRYVDGVAVSSRAIYRDVTAEVQARELLAQAQRTQAATYRAKTAFLDRMSHEMRTPLTAVIGFASILERNRGGRLSEGDIDFARRIGVQGRNLLALIEDVLAYAEIESRRVDLQVATIDVRSLLTEVTGLYAGDAERVDARIVLELPERPQMLETDPSVLRRIVRYLLSDAIPRVAGGTLVVRLDEGDHGVPTRISVRSEGAGADLAGVEPGIECAVQHPELSLTIAESLAQVLGYQMSCEQHARGVSACVVSLAGQLQRSPVLEDNSAKTLHAILEASPLPMIAFEPDWTVRLWNGAAQELYGWTASEAIEQRLPMLRAEDDEGFRDLLRQALDAPHGIADIPVTHHRRDGGVVHAHVSLAPLRATDGRLRGFLGIVTDVTERTRLAEELRQAQRMEVVGRLAGGIAHDFNNLLTVISAHAQFLLLDLPEGDVLVDDARAIQESSERAAALTRQLLLFARKQVSQRRIVDLNTKLADVDRILRRTLGSHVEFVTIPSAGGVCIDADPGQVEQVMMNLILNARDAMPEGGALVVELGTTEEVGVAGGDVRRYATITVSDTGIGMDDVTRERIFEPFFTTKGPDRGTGLGLATVHNIVVESGGTVEVESVVGEGTTFRVRLPIVEGAHDPRSLPEGESSRRGTETVLLVEDEDAVRAVAARALRAYGYEVLLARHGQDALAVLRGAAKVDVLLTDLVMPEMPGNELAERVRELVPGVRVLYMSGYSETPAGLAEHDASVPLVRKPFSGSALAQAVRDVLDA